MAGVCLSIVADPVQPNQLNQIYNSPTKNIGNLPAGAILETVALENFGIDDGEYCADAVCLDVVQSAEEVCGLILHECTTGKMIEYQIPPKGLYCDENDKIWVKITCFKVEQAVCPPQNEAELDPFLKLMCEPCEAVQVLEALIFKTITKEKVVSWSFGGKSITMKHPNTDELYRLLCFYQGKCREHMSKVTCCPSPCNAFTFTPDC